MNPSVAYGPAAGTELNPANGWGHEAEVREENPGDGAGLQNS